MVEIDSTSETWPISEKDQEYGTMSVHKKTMWFKKNSPSKRSRRW